MSNAESVVSFPLGTVNLSFGGGSRAFEATDPGVLGSSEQTLVTIAVDTSGSVDPFKKDLEKCLEEALAACRRDPRADSQMVNVLTFGYDAKSHSYGSVAQVHPIKALVDTNAGDYDNLIQPNGRTPLNDAILTAIDTTKVYAKNLADASFMTNAIIIVITDGEDTSSNNSLEDVRRQIAALKDPTQEALESAILILVGVNVSHPTMKKKLEEYRAAGFDAFITIDEASDKALAKLASWMSSAISNQSSALNTGGPSTILTF